MISNYIYIIIVAIFIFISYQAIHKINNMVIFQPDKKFSLDVFTIENMYDNQDIHLNAYHYFIKTKNNNSISCLELLVPDKDNIFIVSHGNAGNLYYCINSETINNLLKYGSVILYDYSGYGRSTGTPSEDNIYYDLKAVWNNVKTTYPKHKIILYGFSLGCYPTIRLYEKLYKKNNQPYYIILQSGFSNIKNVAKKIVGKSLSNLVTNNFDNISLLNKINNESNKIIILHSKNDEMIPYENAKLLQKNANCLLIKIKGTHNEPIYTKKYFMIMDSLFDDCDQI